MRRAAAHAQQGVVLFIALIILVAMSLAGIALMRGVDTGTIIAGNLAFRQGATFVADIGVEAARAYIQAAAGGTLHANQEAAGYYATWEPTVDLLGNDTDPSTNPFDWSTKSVTVTAAPYVPPTGYAVRYVIHRLCELPGDPAADPAVAVTCMKSAAAGGSTSNSSKGTANYGGYAISESVAAIYRITVQVTGPRNARSYVQTTVF
jgi:Tfp pilus assembly protein PilX